MQRLCATAVRGVIVVLVAFSAGGCSWSTTQAPDVLLTRADTPDTGFDALPGGTLEIDLDRGCVLLQGSPVIWPRGTTLTTEPLALRFPNGVTARPGDVVRGGGGGGYAWQIRETAIRIEGDLDRALECAPRGTEVIVFNAAASKVRPRMLVTHAVNVSETDVGTVLRGRLEIYSDRECILVGGRPVLWPNGTRISTPPTELGLPSGDPARAGDIVHGRGWRVPAAELERASLWVEGDLDRALRCAPDAAGVVVFRAPGLHVSVTPGG